MFNRLSARLVLKRAALRRWLRLHKVHSLGLLAYTGHEILHANDYIFIAILAWVGVCELLTFIHSEVS